MAPASLILQEFSTIQMAWTIEQVLALAPDPSSAKSGRDLAVARKWLTLGANSLCAWGTLQGSGKDAYQTSIDLSGPAFKCTCPSRKFPCKHGLGLFLIYVQQPDGCTQTEPPPWTSEWLGKRAEKEETKAARAAPPAATSDPEAQLKAAAAAEKRAAARESKVSAGLAEMDVWLNDVIRTGFASLPGKPPSFWETPASRLVDAQAPGLARRLRALQGITATGEDWPTRLLRQLTTFHLANEAWSRISTLPVETQSDLRTAVGFTVNQDDVLTQESIHDRWMITGQRIEEEERLRVQRTWLFGCNTKRAALCLSFSAGANQPFDVSLVAGTIVDADLAYFPSAFPLRALVKDRHGAAEQGYADYPHTTILAANAFAAEAFSANPWLELVPFALSAVTPVRRAHGWLVRDRAGHVLPLNIRDAEAWKLLGLSGGNPLVLSGEWDGESLRPVSVWAEGRFVAL